MTTDRDEILKLLRDQDAAVACGDAADVIAPMAHDVTVFDLPPPLLYRGEGLRNADGLNEWFATWEGGVTVELSVPQVLVSGDLPSYSD